MIALALLRARLGQFSKITLLEASFIDLLSIKCAEQVFHLFKFLWSIWPWWKVVNSAIGCRRDRCEIYSLRILCAHWHSRMVVQACFCVYGRDGNIRRPFRSGYKHLLKLMCGINRLMLAVEVFGRKTIIGVRLLSITALIAYVRIFVTNIYQGAFHAHFWLQIIAERRQRAINPLLKRYLVGLRALAAVGGNLVAIGVRSRHWANVAVFGVINCCRLGSLLLAELLVVGSLPRFQFFEVLLFTWYIIVFWTKNLYYKHRTITYSLWSKQKKLKTDRLQIWVW